MSVRNPALWYQTCALGGLLVACSVLDLACGGGGGGGNGDVCAPPVAVSTGGIPSNHQTVHFATNEAEIYDSSTDSFAPTDSMKQARAAAGAEVLQDGSVLFTGGLTTGGQPPNPPESPTNSAEIFDAAAMHFVSLPPMRSPRSFHTVTLLSNGTVVLAGGAASAQLDTTSGTVTYTATQTAEVYNPFVNLFLPAGSLAVARMSAGSALLSNGSVLVAGGVSSFSAGGITGIAPGTLVPLASIEIYDPSARTFTSGGNMNVARIAPLVAALSNGLVLIAGGDDQSTSPSTSTAELYDPVAKTSTSINGISQSVNLAAFSFLSSGDVLFTGGAINDQTFGETAFDFATKYSTSGNTFAANGHLNLARFDHQMTPIGSDLMLITGGVHNDQVNMSNGIALADATFDPCAYLSSGEIYDQSTGKSTNTSHNMLMQRALHSAATLPGGKVLVAGGYSCGAVFNPSPTTDNPSTSSCAPPSFLGKSCTAR